MKRFIFIATALIALASCSDSEFVGENTSQTSQTEQGAIVFGSYAGAITRADYTGSDAAAKLNNNFVVEGVKWDGSGTQEVVFDHYNVNWQANTANTTTSNTANWEYVAQEKHAYGPTGAQAIKYWDYAKSQYDFIAYSKGLGTAVYDAGDYETDKANSVLFSEITPSTMNGVDSNSDGKVDQGAYTIKGKAENLAKCYIADLVTAYRADNNYQNEVDITFRPLSAKVRIGLYETVPGYSVKDVVFYTDASTAATDGKAYLYTAGVFNKEGTYIVYFPTTGATKAPGKSEANTDYNKAHLVFTAEASGTDTKKEFGTLTGSLTAANLAAAEVAEASGNNYLGRSSDAAIYAGTKSPDNYYTIVLPNETGAVLNLKVNYTLLSTDGSGETINVTGATAQVPAVYATWKSGYAYTYLFKISQNTNGVTNPSAGPAGLYPVTFDAVVVNDEVDNTQETITTVATPSITTYAKGTIVTTNDEYKLGKNIYVVVNKGGTNVTLQATTGTINAKLYTVTLTDTDTGDAIATAAQTINEASVANALAHGGSVTDINKFTLAVTEVTSGELTNAAQITAADAPDGNAVTINGAVFMPKYTPVAGGTTLASGIKYYTSNTGDGEITGDGSTVAVAGVYFTADPKIYVFEFIDTEDSNKKYYKIIKVQ